MCSEDTCAELLDSEIIVLQSIYPESNIIVDSVCPSRLHRPTKQNPALQVGTADVLTEENFSNGDRVGGTWLTVIVDIAFDTAKTVVCRGHRPESNSTTTNGNQRDATGEQRVDGPVAVTNGSVLLTTSVLPSLELSFHLPPRYPLQECAELVDVRTHGITNTGSGIANDATCYLPLPVIRALRRRLVTTWAASGEANAREGVLWGFIDWLASGEFVGDADTGLMDNDGVITFTTTYPLTPVYLSQLIASQSAHSRDEAFSMTSFSCGICLETRKGKGCIEMDACGCVFCHDCLQSCWSLAIREGTLSNVACPSFDCTKTRVKRDQDRAENPTQQTPDAGDPTDYVGDDLLSKVVGDVLAERFKRLKEKKRVENDPTYTTCPMAHCQAPVGPPPRQRAKQDIAIKPANNVFRLSSGPITRLDEKDLDKQRQTELDRWDRFRQCEKCGFCFCRICEMGWHGAHVPCTASATTALIQKYLQLGDDSKERVAMEQRYGRAKLKQMVMKHAEDESNRQWMEAKTKSCPNCHSRVEKSEGCNHMTCFRCLCHFCFRCGEKLIATDPYKHYNVSNSKCYQKLFDEGDMLRYAAEDREAARAAEGIPHFLAQAEDFEDPGLGFVDIQAWPFQ